MNAPCRNRPIIDFDDLVETILTSGNLVLYPVAFVTAEYAFRFEPESPLWDRLPMPLTQETALDWLAVTAEPETAISVYGIRQDRMSFVPQDFSL